MNYSTKSAAGRTGALRRVVPQDAVHQHDLLPFRKPTLPTEAASSLSRARRQVESGKDANEQGENALDEEEPAPACETAVTAELKDASSQQRTDDVGGRERDPEETKADRELGGSVVVAQVENGLMTMSVEMPISRSAKTYVGNESSLKEPKKGPSGEEGGLSVKCGLGDGDNGPEYHLRAGRQD